MYTCMYVNVYGTICRCADSYYLWVYLGMCANGCQVSGVECSHVCIYVLGEWDTLYRLGEY